jgi:hypothetical protein
VTNLHPHESKSSKGFSLKISKQSEQKLLLTKAGIECMKVNECMKDGESMWRNQIIQSPGR